MNWPGKELTQSMTVKDPEFLDANLLTPATERGTVNWQTFPLRLAVPFGLFGAENGPFNNMLIGQP
jgi:hypothetical protein